jgi:hypothetical protein
MLANIRALLAKLVHGMLVLASDTYPVARWEPRRRARPLMRYPNLELMVDSCNNLGDCLANAAHIFV